MKNVITNVINAVLCNKCAFLEFLPVLFPPNYYPLGLFIMICLKATVI